MGNAPHKGIVSLITPKGEWDGKQKFLITFSNGEAGMFYTPESTPAPFELGKQAEYFYDEKVDKNGNLWYKVNPAKQKEASAYPGDQSGNPGGYKKRYSPEPMSPEREKAITRQSMAKVASDQVVAGNFSPSQLLYLAEILSEWALGHIISQPLTGNLQGILPDIDTVPAGRNGNNDLPY